MAILTVQDIINRKSELDKEKQIKHINVHSKILDGEIEFHSLSKHDIKDFRDMAKGDPIKASLYFIYMSSDTLRDKALLKAFGYEKKEQYKIVENLFPKEIERDKVLEILFKLNGLDGLNPEDIYAIEVEETKN
jgi:hypothetical protein